MTAIQHPANDSEWVARWEKAASRVAKSSRKTLENFRGHSRLKRALAIQPSEFADAGLPSTVILPLAVFRKIPTS